MAKKKSKDDKKSKESSQKIEFNLDDGISWHDFAGAFWILIVFIGRLIRLILSPIFWVYGENVRMFRFVKADGHQRVMNEDERKFVETIPFIYTLTGLVGGVLVGVFAAYSFQDTIDEFIQSIDVNFLEAFFELLGDIIVFIWTAISWFFTSIFGFFTWIWELIASAFEINQFLAFIGLATIGIVVMLIWIAFVETGAFDKITDTLGRLIEWLIGSPERFRFKVNNYYRRFNHWLTAKLVGKERLHTRTQIYFKKSIFYTIFISIYSFGAGIFVGIDPGRWGQENVSEWEKVLFTALVLFFAGVVSGTIFFALIARFFDLLNRKKYIAPEFIKADGSLDQEKYDDAVKTDEERVKESLKVEKEDKPWKKDDKKKKSDKKD